MTSTIHRLRNLSHYPTKVTHPDPTSPVSSKLLKVYGRPNVEFVKGDGVYLEDSRGLKYLDFASGIAVNALGHNHPSVTEAIKEAAGFIHISNLYHHPYAKVFADDLLGKSWVNDGQVFFCNSGTEANEAVIKFGRKFGKIVGKEKNNVLSFMGAFHGRSMGALSATPAPKYQKPFLPLVPGFVHAKFNDINGAINSINENTCLVLVEPIQGEGGIHPATPDFLKALRDKCDDTGALLAFDEIQCGLGRTGKLFAYEHFGVVPDLLSMAKPLANGIPIGAVILSPKVAKEIALGDHGTTFGGSPFAARVGHSVFSIISKPDFLNHVVEMGQYLHSELCKLSFPAIKEIRGLGLMIGIELKEAYDTQEFVNNCRVQGLLCISAGSNTIRLVPPLIIEKKHIDEALNVFKTTLNVSPIANQKIDSKSKPKIGDTAISVAVFLC